MVDPRFFFDGLAIISLGRATLVVSISGVILAAIAVQFGFPFDKFRLFGFGSGEVSSIDSRLAIVSKYFLSQFAVAPFFGNVAAENLVSGEGSYIHSLPLYALTHTGVLGSLLLFLSIIMALIEQSDRRGRLCCGSGSSAIEMSSVRFLNAALFMVVFCVGVASSSLLWGGFWFAFGFCLVPFGIRFNRGRGL